MHKEVAGRCPGEYSPRPSRKIPHAREGRPSAPFDQDQGADSVDGHAAWMGGDRRKKKALQPLWPAMGYRPAGNLILYLLLAISSFFLPSVGSTRPRSDNLFIFVLHVNT